jgi:hypothetical protein
MTRKFDKYEAIAEGREALIARVKAELKHGDDDDSTEQFLDAEAVVVQYLDAVQSKMATLPTSEELAFACAVLLVPTQAIEQRDMALLGQLCASEVGVDMYAIAPQIEEMKSRAIARLEKMAGQDETQQASSLIDDVPF